MIDGERVGVGVVTCERPGLFRRACESVDRYAAGVADVLCFHQDGPAVYDWYPRAEWDRFRTVDGANVAVAKNLLLQWMSDRRCDHLFLLEDDTVLTDRRAVSGYVAAVKASGVHYLSAHPHGDVTTACAGVDGPVTLWAHVGAMWTYLSRHGCEVGGLYDARFGNHHGDIELPQRWARLGLCSGWGRLPDATGSEAWVSPRCLTRGESLIGNRPGWAEENAAMLAWWAETMPETVPTEMRPCNEGRRSRRCLPAS